jgi:hypothetical protein
MYVRVNNQIIRPRVVMEGFEGTEGTEGEGPGVGGYLLFIGAPFFLGALLLLLHKM